MKRVIVLIAIAIGFTACGSNDGSAEKERQATEKAMREQVAAVGMPSITNWQEKKLAKMIFELRDREDLVTYAYIVNLDGDLIYLGQCVGFGLPYSVQYTNPSTVQEFDVRGGWSDQVVPQADPNGLYMPDGLSATWLMMLDEKTGEVRPVYVEPQIIVSPFKLH